MAGGPSSIQFIDVIGDALLRNVKIQGEFVDNPQFFAEFSPDGKTLVSMANYRYLETMGVDTNAVDHNTLAHPISLGAGGYPFPSLQVNFGERSKDILSHLMDHYEHLSVAVIAVWLALWRRKIMCW